MSSLDLSLPCSQGAVQAGQLKIPPGYHPLDVEKEWGKLHVAILEREKQLRSEFERWAMWRVAGSVGDSRPGWGPVLAGEPPQGESLPEEEPPPPYTHTPGWGTQPNSSVQGQRDSTPWAGSEARAEGSPSLTLECGGPSDSLWDFGVICFVGWSVFSA